jgi:hypothetical protein
MLPVMIDLEFRQRTCNNCRMECSVRGTINLADPREHCPIWKWVDDGWRSRQQPRATPNPSEASSVIHYSDGRIKHSIYLGSMTATMTLARSKSAPCARLKERIAVFHEIWREIHAADRWIDEWITRLPCPECQQHTRQYLVASPPPIGAEFPAWAIAFHNAVNRRLDKPQFMP